MSLAFGVTFMAIELDAKLGNCFCSLSSSPPLGGEEASLHGEGAALRGEKPTLGGEEPATLGGHEETPGGQEASLIGERAPLGGGAARAVDAGTDVTTGDTAAGEASGVSDTRGEVPADAAAGKVVTGAIFGAESTFGAAANSAESVENVEEERVLARHEL